MPRSIWELCYLTFIIESKGGKMQRNLRGIKRQNFGYEYAQIRIECYRKMFA